MAIIMGRNDHQSRVAHLRNFWTPYLMILPALVTTFVVTLIPTFRGFALGFTDYYLLRGMNSAKFNFLDNFAKLVFDKDYLFTLKNTIIFVVGSSAGPTLFGMILALLLNNKIRFRAIYRGLALLPWTMPMVVVGVIWKWILQPDWGLVNILLLRMKAIRQPIQFFSDKNIVWFTLIAISTWKWMPLSFVNYLAGLQAIPRELFEAAKIDGAGSAKCFRFITIPCLMPILLVTVLLQIIWMWNDFNTIYVFTRGGPGISTAVSSILVYQTAFSIYRMGYAATMGVVQLVLMVAITVIFIKSTRLIED